MAVVTFNGPIGAGGPEVGALTARLLNSDYVDRLILAEAAKRIGSTVEVLEIKEQRAIQMRDRLTYFFQTVLERSAMSGAGGEPYFNSGMVYLPSEEYTDLAEEPVTAAQRLNDQHFIDVTSAVIKEMAKAGNVVIIGRGSNMILKKVPGVLHVGLVTPSELRVRTIVEREHLSWKEAEKYATNLEKARVIYFKKFFKVDPNSPHLFHMTLNMPEVGVETAAHIAASAAERIASEATQTQG